MCPDCRQPIAACRCGAPALPKGDGVLRVSRETKGRGGKAVTVVKGAALDAAVSMLTGVVACPAIMFGTVPDDSVIEAAVDVALKGSTSR